ncbi:unnamed protein product, partial [Polarella glacialis]
DLDWLLEILMISTCSATYHSWNCRRSADNSTSVSAISGCDGGGPQGCRVSRSVLVADVAWDWVVRLGLCLTEKAKAHGADTLLLAPLALLAVLCAVLLPGLWRGTSAAPLRDAIENMQIPHGDEDLSLLRMSLPEDILATGLVQLPILGPASSAKQASRAAGTAFGGTAQHFQDASVETPTRTLPEEAENDDVSEDEVVLCSPVVRIASPLKAKQHSPPTDDMKVGTKVQSVSADPASFCMPAPDHLHAAVRRARVRYALRASASPETVEAYAPVTALSKTSLVKGDSLKHQIFKEVSPTPSPVPEEDFEEESEESHCDSVMHQGNESFFFGQAPAQTGLSFASRADVPPMAMEANPFFGQGLMQMYGLHPDIASMAAAAAASAAAAAVAAWSPPSGFVGAQELEAMQHEAAMCAAALASGAFHGRPMPSLRSERETAGRQLGPEGHVFRGPPPGLTEDWCSPPMVDLGFLDDAADSLDLATEASRVDFARSGDSFLPKAVMPPPGLELPAKGS